MSDISLPNFDELMGKALENFGIVQNNDGHTRAFRGAGYAALALAQSIHRPTDQAGFENLVDSAIDQLDPNLSAGNPENPNTYVIRGHGYSLLALATAIREQRTR
jgi:hypothetical protein